MPSGQEDVDAVVSATSRVSVTNQNRIGRGASPKFRIGIGQATISFATELKAAFYLINVPSVPSQLITVL